MDGVTGSHGNTQLVTDDFKIKGAATRPPTKGAATVATPDTCTICLEPITERAVAVLCNHLTFDFLCLVSWLQEQATCPLCKAPVTEVQYDWRSSEDYKTYHVPKPRAGKAHLQSAREQDRRRSLVRPMPREGITPAVSEDPALERRRRVYRDRTYSLHVGANRVSQCRDLTPQTFTASPELQSRARAFLRRELKVFTFLDTAPTQRGGTRDFLIEYIVAVLKTNELKGANGHAEDFVAEFLGMENARLLLHEIEAWLRSPFTRLEEWDGQVQYRQISAESKD